MDYPKLISEKWNLTAKFNCLQAIYFYAPRPSALAVRPYVWLRLSIVLLDYTLQLQLRVLDYLQTLQWQCYFLFINISVTVSYLLVTLQGSKFVSTATPAIHNAKPQWHA